MDCESSLNPIFPKEFDGMLRANCAIATAKVFSWTVLIAPPADTFWMLRVEY
jgi:hypothetical protein